MKPTDITENVVQRIWNLCNILRGDGISYHEYISELTYLLFLKIAEENGTEKLLPLGYRWADLISYQGDKLLTFYQEMLTHLGGYAKSRLVRDIYAFPTTVFSHSENLRAVIDGIAKIDWHSISADGMGIIYEGLLAKNSQDIRSGAGQYFTPRALVDCLVRITKPAPGEVIQDPATGSGGFIIAADQYVRATTKQKDYAKRPPTYQGVEIERGTYRICLMNVFLHELKAKILLGDALTTDAAELEPADLILANPPFGSKAGSARGRRENLPYSLSNKQLAFLQHIYLGLKPKGRAAVVLPDSVLFEEGVGKKVRQDLMDKCDLHTILRLPTGIFYSQGVKTNVLFFTRGVRDKSNTKRVRIYDMRSGMPSFGKTRQLSADDFLDFEKAYAGTGSGTKRKISNKRFKSFTRAEIRSRDDNLDISWLIADANKSTSTEPVEIMAAITIHLRLALDEIETLLARSELPLATGKEEKL
jgi:type I restriction enzyme M protein